MTVTAAKALSAKEPHAVLIQRISIERAVSAAHQAPAPPAVSAARLTLNAIRIASAWYAEEYAGARRPAELNRLGATIARLERRIEYHVRRGWLDCLHGKNRP